MSETAPSGKWRKRRLAFRWFRIGVLVLVLLAVISLIWLNQVGVPGFVKKQLLAGLRERGVEIQFDRLRLRWYRGIVAESVTIGQTTQSNGPRLSAEEITVRVNGAALRRARFEPEGLMLRNGRLTLPLAVSNQPPYQITITNIQSELLLLPDDHWELADLQASALGCLFSANGTLAHASSLPQLLKKMSPSSKPTLPGEPPRPRSLWQNSVRRVAQEIEAIQFASPPELSLQLHADATDTNQFRLHLKLQSRDARTRWGNVRDLSLDVPVLPVPGSNGLAQADVTLQFSRLNSQTVQAGATKLDLHVVQSVTNPLPLRVTTQLKTRLLKGQAAEAGELNLTVHSLRAVQRTNEWHSQINLDSRRLKMATNTIAALQANLNVRHSLGQLALIEAAGELHASGLKTSWGSASNLTLSADSVLFTNRFGLASTGNCELQVDVARGDWGKVEQAKLSGRLTRREIPLAPEAALALGAWTNAWPLTFSSQTSLRGLKTPKLTVAAADFNFRWAAPRLEMNSLKAELFGGALALDVSLDVLSRRLEARGNSAVHPAQLGAWSGADLPKPLAPLTLAQAPDLNFTGSVTLPAWTNPQPDWTREVWPTLDLEGGLRLGEGAYRQAQFQSLRTRFKLSPPVLILEELNLQLPDGAARVDYRSDLTTGDFHWKFDSGLNPKAVLQALETEEQRGLLDELQLTTAPTLRGELFGRWGDAKSLGGHAEVALSDFVFRGGAISNLTGFVHYTNLVATGTNVVVSNGGNVLNVPLVVADIAAERLYFSNIVSTFDPYLATRMIGQSTFEAIEPYRFATPPTVYLNGSMPFANEKETDLHFDIEGGPFHWWKLNFDHLHGQVHWVTNTLTIADVRGRGYGGSLNWNGYFDFSPPKQTDFRFNSEFADFDFNRVIGDLHQPTNSVQGRVTGTLNVTEANTRDDLSWMGFGRVQLREGYLWDIPMVGMFSSVLNSIVPGLGKSPVREGAGDFTITNSVVHTRNLELKASTMRLQYRGTVDLDGRVNAEVEAELFRDAWVVGRIFSLAMAPITKAFVYKVTGTLNDPRSEPLYIPKLLLYPLKPFKLIKDLVTPDGEAQKPKPEPEK